MKYAFAAGVSLGAAAVGLPAALEIRARRTYGTRCLELFSDGGLKMDGYYGWLPKPNLRDVKGLNAPRVNTDENGCRIDRRRLKSGDLPKISMVGDSFTFGCEVYDDETVPAYLNEKFQRVNFVNKGVPAWGLDQIYLRVKKEALNRDFSAMVIGMIPQDVIRMAMSKYLGMRKPFLTPGKDGALIYHSPPAEPLWSNLEKMARRRSVYLLLRDLPRDDEPRDERIKMKGAPFDVRDLAEKVVEELGRLQRESGRPFVFVTFPNSTEIPYEFELSDRLCRKAAAVGLYSLDLFNRYAKMFTNNAEFISPVQHLNANGNRVAAADLGTFLQEKGIVNNLEK